MAYGQAGQKRQAEAQTLTPDQIEVGQKWLQLVAKARSDKALKDRLMNAPAVVLQEHGMKVRPGTDVRVVENTDNGRLLNSATQFGIERQCPGQSNRR
jgi:hypothetical protein